MEIANGADFDLESSLDSKESSELGVDFPVGLFAELAKEMKINSFVLVSEHLHGALSRINILNAIVLVFNCFE